jgi:hypothetical protein
MLFSVGNCNVFLETVKWKCSVYSCSVMKRLIIANTFISALARASGNIWTCSWRIEEPDASLVRFSKLWYVFAFVGAGEGHDFTAVCQMYPSRPQFVVMQNYTVSLYCLHASAAVAFPLTLSASDILTGDRHPNYECYGLVICDSM